ncbi:MAG: amino acid ABC transporter ATP-binding protein [Nocardioidaceae bacterium]
MRPSTDVRDTGGGLPLLELTNVHKSFGSLEVLKGVSLQVRSGETVVVLGRSGSGKSTMLRCINCLESIQGGAIRVDGGLMGYELKGSRLRHASDAKVSRQRRKVGIVFQHFNLFPHMTALQNLVEAPVGVLRRQKSESLEDAQRLLARVGLEDKASVYPRQLSGGQQQRVAIARALAMRPQLMLFDEPTSALDPELVGEVLRTMEDLSSEGLTMVVVTHEVGFARKVADRVVFMHEGVIVEDGPTAQVLEAPRDRRTAEFLSKVLA